MQKYIKLAATLLLTLVFLSVISVYATAQEEAKAAKPEKVSFVGLIDTMKINNTLFGGRKSATATIIREDGHQIVLNIDKHTLIAEQVTGEAVKKKQLQDGQVIYVSFSVSTPITTSDPPAVTPEIIVILDEKSNIRVKHDIFDSNGISSDKSLRITINEQTQVTDKNNKPLSIEAAAGKELLVFYDAHTPSANGVPPQVIANRVIVVEQKS